MFKRVNTTKGILDLSGEQVEVFSAGDSVKLAEHVKVWLAEPSNVYTVADIGYNTLDPNDMVLYTTSGHTIHRMDAEHV